MMNKESQTNDQYILYCIAIVVSFMLYSLMFIYNSMHCRLARTKVSNCYIWKIPSKFIIFNSNTSFQPKFHCDEAFDKEKRKTKLIRNVNRNQFQKLMLFFALPWRIQNGRAQHKTEIQITAHTELECDNLNYYPNREMVRKKQSFTSSLRRCYFLTNAKRYYICIFKMEWKLFRRL